MNKFELYERWSHVCDTNKLVDSMREILSKYNHPNTEFGVCEMLNEFFSNKYELIMLLQKSKHYIGDMRIALDIQIERYRNDKEVRKFCRTFPDEVSHKDAILKRVDEHGKTVTDYFKAGTKKVKARNLHYGNARQLLLAEREITSAFDYKGYTQKSILDAVIFEDVLMHAFGKNPQSKVGESLAKEINDVQGLSVVEGMKTSRAFNKVCKHYGVDQLPEYNKLFAKYADMVSGLKRNIKFFISVNPLDYLMMSFGNSWASCHTIDKQNIREMPCNYSGEYCGGTVSYMLDHTTFITYVYDTMPDSFEEGKLYRNMFHFNNGTLLQGRIYPQGNDGATDLYKTFRGIVQDEFTQLLDLESTTWVKKTGSCTNMVNTFGVHYPDYYYIDDCNVSYPKEMPEAAERKIDIGHHRICPYCGTEMDIPSDEWGDEDNSNRLVCDNCY
jgi:hypothetical protein